MKFSKKSLGQNFLRDKNVIKKILNTVKIKNKNVVEIGPGDGALTEQILKSNPKSLILIEKDFNLSLKLKLRFEKNKSVKIVCQDFLKFDLEKSIKKDTIILEIFLTIFPHKFS